MTLRARRCTIQSGDGALTSGLAYEGLNNAGHSERDMIVVLNDNEPMMHE